MPGSADAPALRAAGPVSVVVPYWSFFEYSVPSDLRADRMRRAGAIVGELASEGFDVGQPLLVDSLVAARRQAETAREAAAVLVVQTMAVPPAYTTALLDLLPGVPVVIAAVHGAGPLPERYTHADVTVEGATVGTSMLTSTLVRRGRPFDLVVGRALDSGFRAALSTALTAAVLAGRLRRARIGLVGREIDGYDCVTLNTDELQSRVGITAVRIEPAEFEDAFREVPAPIVRAEERRVRSCFAVDSTLTDEELERSARATLALRHITSRHRLDGGAFNCHVPQIRHSAAVGIAPCLALGEATTAGVPWTCAGDVATAVAMTAVKSLGLPALYHELETIDYDSGELVIANTGEHDAGLAAGPAELRPNPWFSEGTPRSVCAVLSPPAGPASLVAFAQLDSHTGSPAFRLVVATGRFTGTAYPGTGTPNAGFAFSAGPAADAWKRWCMAGANHHSAATPAHVADVLERTALHLGCQFVGV